MGDPLRELEEQLERLAPAGLSESGRSRLEDQIDELAEGVESSSAGAPWWRSMVGVAAALALVGGLVIAYERQNRPPAVAGSDETSEPGSGMLVEEGLRKVSEAGLRGIILTPNNEPMHAWGYKVKQEELIFDPESGFRIRVVSEAEEEVLTEVTSF